MFKKEKESLSKIPECIKGQGEMVVGESLKTSGLEVGAWGLQTGTAT